jgi:hypothetical protein
MVRSINNLGEHLDTFARQYRIAFADAILYPFPNSIANDVYHLVGAAFALLGLLLIFRRAHRSFLAAFAAAYGAMLFLAPVAEPRYAWPLYPLIGAGFAFGLTTAVRRFLPQMSQQRQTALVMAAPLVLLAITLVRHAQREAPPSLVRHPHALMMFAWLRNENSSAANKLRVAYANPRVLTLETEVRAMGIVPRTPPGMLAALTRLGATHLVSQSVGLGPAANPGRPSCVQRVAGTLPELYPTSFTLVYQNPTFRVYRFHPTPGSADDPGKPISWSDC